MKLKCWLLLASYMLLTSHVVLCLCS